MTQKIDNLCRCHDSHFLEKVFDAIFKKHLGIVICFTIVYTYNNFDSNSIYWPLHNVLIGI